MTKISTKIRAAYNSLIINYLRLLMGPFSSGRWVIANNGITFGRMTTPANTEKIGEPNFTDFLYGIYMQTQSSKNKLLKLLTEIKSKKRLSMSIFLQVLVYHNTCNGDDNAFNNKEYAQESVINDETINAKSHNDNDFNEKQ